MAKTITGTLIKVMQNPYASTANTRPPYIALISFPQPPTTPAPAGYTPPNTMTNPSADTIPTNPAVVAFELTAAEIGSLTPGCTVVFTSGTVTPVVLPAT